MLVNITMFLIEATFVVALVRSSPVQGLLRLISPEVQSGVALLMIFGLRPLFVHRIDDTGMYGFRPSADGEFISQTVGFVGIAALTLGAKIASDRHAKLSVGEPEHDRPTALYPTFLVSPVKVLLVAVGGAVLYTVTLISLTGPTILITLAGGRVEEETLPGVPVAVMLIPLAGSVAAGCYLLVVPRANITPYAAVVLLMSVLLSLGLVSQLGSRRFIIPSVLLPGLAYAVRNRPRLSPWTCAFMGGAILVLAAVPMVRSAGARLPGQSLPSAVGQYISTNGVVGTLEPLITSNDTEMLDYVALVATSYGWEGPRGLGRGTVREFVLSPLPNSWNPMGFADQVMAQYWGGGCGNPACPVASVAGVLYFDGGLPFVVVGCLIFGYFIRRISLGLNDFSADRLRPTLIWMCLGTFALIATRTNTIYALWWMIYLCVLALPIQKYLYAGKSIVVDVSEPREPHRSHPTVSS